ncbi:NAD-dependent epimerase/dehydratase family protein [Moraxella oblonga]|uniref:NAD-dependent epimerase/dehydratase family protein n=1 Tax=Moraxella oblonga TaxID=200413 RepID=UPI0008338966|nr:NAD-dependent epimerase/dehydratase family protein [Moraxella oblonga]
MKILLLGSSGFIGRHLLKACQQNNFLVICPTSKELDFLNPNDEVFKDLLKDIDVIINTVGIMSRDKQLMQTVHCDTPILFAKIAKDYANDFNKKIQWLNLSALGADENSDVAFVKSKGQGDKGVLALADDYFKVSIVRPSLIYGDGGASTKLFLQLAKFPILPLPKGGNFNIQPVHADDVVLGIVTLIGNYHYPNIINFTGNQILTLKDYLILLRKNHYQKDKAIIISMPFFIAKIGALILQNFTNLISIDSLTLLKNGNVADNGVFKALIKQSPLSIHKFT